jgi:hypothetical protein
MRAKKLLHAAEPQNRAPCDISKPVSPWKSPFDFGTMPPTIVEACGKLAPFLFGRQGAEYDTEFFHNVLLLSNSGLREKDLSDVVCPQEWFQAWPASADGRHNFIDCADPKLKAGASEMYIQVYGAPPDNGGVSSNFLRGMYVFREEKRDVNWAEWAAKIHSGHMKNAGRNPNKLTPPALREQIQGLLKVFCDYVHGSLETSPLASTPSSSLLCRDPGVTSQSKPLQKRRSSLSKPERKRHKSLTAGKESEPLGPTLYELEVAQQ